MNFHWVRPVFTPFLETHRIISVVLYSLALLCAVWLIRADKPWERGVEARVAKGLAPRVNEYATSGLWYAGVCNTLLLSILGATTSFWCLKKREPSGAEIGRERILPADCFGSPKVKLLWMLLLLASLGFALAERVPRLTHSLWNDEAYSLRRYVWGCERPASNHPGGSQLQFHGVSWQETLFLNRGANNHILFSVCAKWSLGAWAMFSGAKEGEFSEVAFRFPSLIAGLLSILALAWLGAINGAPFTGLGAACLLAFHPWHIRYSTEGRGYALLMLFLTLAMIMLIRALRRNELRWWLGFAVCQALFMLAFPGAIYEAAALFIVGMAIITLVWGFNSGGQRCGRLIVAEIISAILFFQLYSPSIPQVRLYLQREIARGTMDWDWAKDIFAHLLCGLPWKTCGNSGSHLGLGLIDLASDQPITFWFLLVIIPCATLMGCFFCWRRRFEFGALISTGFLGPVLALAHNKLSGNFLFSWYLIFSLPVLSLSCACAGLPVTPSQSVVRAWGRITVSCLLIGVFVFVTADVRKLLRTIPRQPMREASQFVGAQAKQLSHSIRVVAVGTSAGQIAVYDPRAEVVETAEQLRLALRDAHFGGDDLYVYAAGLEKIRRLSPELAELLENSRVLEPVAEFKGLEEMFSYTIFRACAQATQQEADKS